MERVVRRPLYARIIPWFGLVAAVGLWLAGGVPMHQVDSLLPLAEHALASGGSPKQFNYPSLVVYLLCLPYGALNAILGSDAVREAKRAVSFGVAEGPFTWELPGHALIVAFAALGVVSVWRAARALALPLPLAFAAAAALATALLWVTDAHVITVDVPLAALIVAAAAACLRALRAAEAPGIARLAWIGALAGLAAAAKYNGALVLFPIVAALTLDAHSRRRGRIAALLVPSASALLTFLLCNPYVLLESARFWRDFQFELNHARLGHDGYETENGFLLHLRESLVRGYGVTGVTSALLGFVVVLFRRDLRTPSKVLVLGFPLLHYAVIGASALTFDRYMLPMLPFLALGSALALAAGARLLRPLLGAPAAAGLVGLGALAVIGPNLWRALVHVHVLSRPDVRRDLIAVLGAAELPRDKPIFCGEYGGSCLRKARMPLDVTLTHLELQFPDPRTDLLLFDSFSHDRLLHGEPVPFVQVYRGHEDWSVVRFTPYRAPREQVPYAPKSLISPYPPDLAWRDRPGPFVEIYCHRAADAEALARAAGELGVPFERARGADGYFLGALAARARALGR